jgi:hypothetical protein
MQLDFDIIRKELFAGTLSQLQVNGINDLLSEFVKANLTDKRHLAYILSTVYHETGKRMQPVKELGGEAYLKSKKYYPYYGRDLVQTTWKDNYEKVQKTTGVPVVANPDLIGMMPLAAEVAVLFMNKGWYTGKKLSDYFNDKKEDPINARRIINGTDRAQMIAGYYSIFLRAIK